MKAKWSRHLDGSIRIKSSIHSIDVTADKKCLNFFLKLFKIRKKASQNDNGIGAVKCYCKERGIVQKSYQYHTSLLSSETRFEEDTMLGVTGFSTRHWQNIKPITGRVRGRPIGPSATFRSTKVNSTILPSYKNVFQGEHVTSTPLLRRANIRPKTNSSVVSMCIQSDIHACAEGTQGKQPLLQKRPLFPNLDQRRPPLWASKTELSKEIQRLGALCEARTKELNLVKMQLKHAAAGFEAFSVLIKYMIEDLNAFSGPKVALEMKKTKEDLNKNLLQLRQYQNQIEDLKLNHAQEISNLTEKVSRIHNDELCDLKNKHSCELEEAKCHHEKKVLEMKELYEKTIYRNEEQYLKIMEELKDEYVKQKHELEQLHKKQLSNSIFQHEKTQGQLIIQLKTLEQQYEELQEQAREIEETLKKSSDAKMQWLVSKKNDLEKEVESLKTVMEMKQSEIRTLRKENLEMKKELEELPLARDKIQKLRARKEELEALIEERSRAQSVLSTEHEQLKEHFEKESDINRKLAMEKEELQWKLQQSMETSSLLASLSESSSVNENNSLTPTRLSSSFHSYSNTSEKSNSHHSLNASTYKSYRRSSSLSETTLPSCKKLKQFWESSPVTGDNVRKIGIRSNSFLKPLSSQISKHPKHRSFTLQSGRSFADHIKSSDIKEEISKEHYKTEKLREKDNNDSEEIDKPENNFISQNLSCDMISMEEDKSQFGKSLKWRFKLPKTEDTLPIKKLFENSVKNNHKKDEHKINHSLEQMDQSGKSLSPEFVVVLETSGNVAAYKTNTEQGDDAGLEESSKFSDSIEGSFISSQDGFDNSNNLSCSLQSSIVSDDSAWSNTSFPPHRHIDRTNQDFISVSPSSEDDSFSNSSSGSPKNPNQIEEHSIHTEQDESSSSAEQSQCIEENCQFRTTSPKSLAGEAMIQDDSPISVSQMSEEFSIPMPCKKHKKIEKLEINQECINKNSWEVTCVNKEKVISSNNAETPSMETTSQGLLMTNSNIDDISWDSEDMPSESEI